MTPEEKTKHLEALEDMYSSSVSNSLEFTTCKADYDALAADELKWRAAIDAFEAQALELEQLRADRAARTAAFESLRAATARLVQELGSHCVRASQLEAVEAVTRASQQWLALQNTIKAP